MTVPLLTSPAMSPYTSSTTLSINKAKPVLLNRQDRLLVRRHHPRHPQVTRRLRRLLLRILPLHRRLALPVATVLLVDICSKL